MKKNVFRWIVLAVLVLLMLGCAKKTLHCDGCGKEVKVSADSNLTEDAGSNDRNGSDAVPFFRTAFAQIARRGRNPQKRFCGRLSFRMLI